VQRLDGCCSKEVEGGGRCVALKVVALDGAVVLSVVGFVDVLAGDSRDLGE
jgi:hypothetical protein